MYASRIFSWLMPKDRQSLAYRPIPFGELGVDINVLSPTSKDLVTRLSDSPGARDMVQRLCSVAHVKLDSANDVKRH